MKYFCLEKNQVGLTVSVALVPVEDGHDVAKAMEKALPHIAKWHNGCDLLRGREHGNEIVIVSGKDEKYPLPRYIINQFSLQVLE